MADHDVPPRLVQYVEALNGILGARPVLEHVPPRLPEDGIVVGLVYRDVPGPGYVTGFTYGLSLVRHGKQSAPSRELTITVRSTDTRWATVPAGMVAALRGMSPFNPGEVLGYMKPYVEGSAMNSAVLAAPAMDSLRERPVPVGAGGRPDAVGLVGVYPLYATEREQIRRNGFDAFWSLDWDRFDPARPPVV